MRAKAKAKARPSLARRVETLEEQMQGVLVGQADIRTSLRSLSVCNTAIVKQLAELRDGQERLAERMAGEVRTSLLGELREMRADLKGEIVALGKVINGRPCIAGDCPTEG